MLPAKRRGTPGDEFTKEKVAEPTLNAKCKAVASVLSAASELPKACREMMSAGVAVSLAVPRTERDPRQVAMATFIGETFMRAEVALIFRVADAEAAGLDRVEAAVRALSEASCQVETAEAKASAAIQEMVVCREALAEEQANVSTAAAAADAAEAARCGGEGGILAGSLERDACEAGALLLLHGEGHGGPQASQEHVATLQKVGKKIGLEDSLLFTLPIVIRKPLADRSVLDKAAAQLLSDALTNHAADIAESLAEESKAMEERDRAAQAAKSALEAVESLRATAAAAVAASEASYALLERTLESCRRDQKRCEADLAIARSGETRAMEELEKFRSGPLSSFLELLDDPAKEDELRQMQRQEHERQKEEREERTRQRELERQGLAAEAEARRLREADKALLFRAFGDKASSAERSPKRLCSSARLFSPKGILQAGYEDVAGDQDGGATVAAELGA